MIKEQNIFGSIEVICGNMFSGKTEELIRRLRRAKIARLNVKIFKPKVDTRYEEGNIVSHNQLKLKSLVVESILEINELASSADVVGIDEAQFFDDNIINVVKQLSSKGKRVIVAGLDTDFRGEPFGPMPKLMCEADFLDKLQAICVICGNPASYTQRISKDDSQIVVGEMDIYEARCRHCYLSPG
jgi:thymidine kinase|tara:strand:- start:482 stop:1039 length:558 start_codon:yes stop_codon:yes gene_type:complete